MSTFLAVFALLSGVANIILFMQYQFLKEENAFLFRCLRGEEKEGVVKK
jgi:hypothetical protein